MGLAAVMLFTLGFTIGSSMLALGYPLIGTPLLILAAAGAAYMIRGNTDAPTPTPRKKWGQPSPETPPSDS